MESERKQDPPFSIVNRTHQFGETFIFDGGQRSNPFARTVLRERRSKQQVQPRSIRAQRQRVDGALRPYGSAVGSPLEKIAASAWRPRRNVARVGDDPSFNLANASFGHSRAQVSNQAVNPDGQKQRAAFKERVQAPWSRSRWASAHW